MEITDEKIWRIIRLFADGDDKTGVWGYDTEIYPTRTEAIRAVRKILEEEKEKVRK